MRGSGKAELREGKGHKENLLEVLPLLGLPPPTISQETEDTPHSLNQQAWGELLGCIKQDKDETMEETRR